MDVGAVRCGCSGVLLLLVGLFGQDAVNSVNPNLDPQIYTGSDQLTIGFRVAMIPEPSSLSLLLAGGLVALAGRRKA